MNTLRSCCCHVKEESKRFMLEQVGVPQPVPFGEVTGLDSFHINRCGEGYYYLKALAAGSSDVREAPGYKQRLFLRIQAVSFLAFHPFPLLSDVMKLLAAVIGGKWKGMGMMLSRNLEWSLFFLFYSKTAFCP